MTDSLTDKYKLVDCEDEDVVQVINKPENTFCTGKIVVPIKVLRCYTSCYSPESCECAKSTDATTK